MSETPTACTSPRASHLQALYDLSPAIANLEGTTARTLVRSRGGTCDGTQLAPARATSAIPTLFWFLDEGVRGLAPLREEDAAAEVRRLCMLSRRWRLLAILGGLILAAPASVLLLPYSVCACLTQAEGLERLLWEPTGEDFLRVARERVRLHGGGAAAADDDPALHGARFSMLAVLPGSGEVYIPTERVNVCADRADTTLLFDFRGRKHPLIEAWEVGLRAAVTCRDGAPVAARLYRYERAWRGLRLEPARRGRARRPH